MKIILTSAISALGKIGDIIEVKSGYARNFLIPNRKAIPFTQNNAKIFESRRHEFELANKNGLEQAEKVKNQILGKDIIIIENASDDGRLYGSVNSAVIADHINKMLGQKSINRADIVLKKPIKETGLYEAKLIPHPEVDFGLRLVVSRSNSEAEAMLKSKKIDRQNLENSEGSIVSESKSANLKKSVKKKVKSEEKAE